MKVPAIEGAEIEPVKNPYGHLTDDATLQSTAQLTLHSSFELTTRRPIASNAWQTESPRFR